MCSLHCSLLGGQMQVGERESQNLEGCIYWEWHFSPRILFTYIYYCIINQQQQHQCLSAKVTPCWSSRDFLVYYICLTLLLSYFSSSLSVIGNVICLHCFGKKNPHILHLTLTLHFDKTTVPSGWSHYLISYLKNKKQKSQESLSINIMTIFHFTPHHILLKWH